MNLAALLIGAPICAIAGAQFGHFLGVRLGHRMFDRPESRIFKRVYVEKAEHYFNKFGPAKAVLLARFIPIVRTFLNPVAGVSGDASQAIPDVEHHRRQSSGLTASSSPGDSLGSSIPAGAIDKYLLPVIALILLISVVPIIIEVARNLREKQRTRAAERAHQTAASTTSSSEDDDDDKPAPATAGRSQSPWQ